MNPETSSKTSQESENSQKSDKSQKKALYWLQYYLAQRSHSELELKTKLLKKGFDPEEVSQVLVIAMEKGWMDDPGELAEKVAKSWHEKNKSHNWIQAYLRDKGLPKTSKCRELEAQKAHILLAKKFSPETINLNYTKAASYLSGRGFSYEDFQNAVELLKNEES